MARKNLTKRQKLYLSLSSILLAMGAFVGLLLGLAVLFYFMEAFFLKK